MHDLADIIGTDDNAVGSAETVAFSASFARAVHSAVEIKHRVGVLVQRDRCRLIDLDIIVRCRPYRRIGMGIGMAGPIAQAMSGQQPASGVAPPPLPGSSMYFLAVGGKQTGPFDLQALKSQAATGALTAQSLVWTQGMPDWKPAGQVEELAAILANLPPPIPPQS